MISKKEKNAKPKQKKNSIFYFFMVEMKGDRLDKPRNKNNRMVWTHPSKIIFSLEVPEFNGLTTEQF